MKNHTVILVTGCGSGIGLALARQLYEKTKYSVVVTARANSMSLLKEKFCESDRFLIRELDVSNETQRKNLVTEIAARWFAYRGNPARSRRLRLRRDRPASRWRWQDH